MRIVAARLWLSVGLVFAAEAVCFGQTFVPPEIETAEGFEIELIAAPPLVGYPMMACFDDQGHLFVAESDGQNLTKKEEYLEQRPRFVRRLEDVDGDGTFDRSTIFADQMTMPEGGLWHNGALYIISAPYLWRLEDVDGDGVADRREKILGTMEFDGRANQHGPYLGPNGRLYFSGGHFGFDFVGSDGSRSGKSRAAGVFSCWPDGSDVRVFGQGPVNPVDVAFTPEGELLTTCAIFDGVGGRHDAIVHWVPGGLTQRIYGDPVLPDTGHRLPAMTRWGQVAPGGFMRYRGTQLGKRFRDTYFACQFNGHKVAHVRLQRQGASFVSLDRDFVWSQNVDFHPADILEDADGSLVLLDTGAWLSWGCPFSKVAKPEIKGAIYRIRRSDVQPVLDPRGSQLEWAEGEDLIARLSDPRPAVRDRAVEGLVSLGGSGLRSVAQSYLRTDDAATRRRLVWVLSRIGGSSAISTLRLALRDSDVGVRQAAIRSLGSLKDHGAVSELLNVLQAEPASLRRAAASALGELSDPRISQALLELAATETDHYVMHALVYSLIQKAELRVIRDGLRQDQSPAVQQVSLRVLDQLGNETLEADDVLPFLSSHNSGLRQEAQRLVAGRSEWKPALLDLYHQWVERADIGDAELIEGLMGSMLADEALQTVIGTTLTDSEVGVPLRALMLHVLGSVIEVPPLLAPAVRQCLGSADSELIRGGLTVVPRLEGDPFSRELEEIVVDTAQDADIRVKAAIVLSEGARALTDQALAFLFQELTQSKSDPLRRQSIAVALGNVDLDASRIPFGERLLSVIPLSGVMEVRELVRPFVRLAQVPPEVAAPIRVALARKLFDQFRLASVRKAIDESLAESIFASFDKSLQRDLRELYRSGSSGNDSDLKVTVSSLALDNGNASRGEIAFLSGRGACVTCHQIDSKGGALGPNLSKIGAIRQPADLLDAILHPSATIVNGFETYEITTTQGQSFSGVIARETSDRIVLKDAAQQTTQIPRREIHEMRISTISTMPEGLAEALSEEELLDIVAFLSSRR